MLEFISTYLLFFSIYMATSSTSTLNKSLIVKFSTGCVYLLHLCNAMHVLFLISRNSHKDCMRWSFKRAAKASTIIRGNFSLVFFFFFYSIHSLTLTDAFCLLWNCINIYSRLSTVFTKVSLGVFLVFQLEKLSLACKLCGVNSISQSYRWIHSFPLCKCTVHYNRISIFDVIRIFAHYFSFVTHFSQWQT